jgi:hypothetical protein
MTRQANPLGMSGHCVRFLHEIEIGNGYLIGATDKGV